MTRRRLQEIWYKNRKDLLIADRWAFWTGIGFLFFLTHTLEVLSLLVVHERWIAFSTSCFGSFSKTTLLLSGIFTGAASVVFLLVCLGNLLYIKQTLSGTSEQENRLDLLAGDVVRAKTPFLRGKAIVRLVAYCLPLLVARKGLLFHKREARLFKRRRKAFKLAFRKKNRRTRTFQEIMRGPDAAPPDQPHSSETNDKRGDAS